jgi:hypothetical protein
MERKWKEIWCHRNWFFRDGMQDITESHNSRKGVELDGKEADYKNRTGGKAVD